MEDLLLAARVELELPRELFGAGIPPFAGDGLEPPRGGADRGMLLEEPCRLRPEGVRHAQHLARRGNRRRLRERLEEAERRKRDLLLADEVRVEDPSELAGGVSELRRAYRTPICRRKPTWSSSAPRARKLASLDAWCSAKND